MPEGKLRIVLAVREYQDKLWFDIRQFAQVKKRDAEASGEPYFVPLRGGARFMVERTGEFLDMLSAFLQTELGIVATFRWTGHGKFSPDSNPPANDGG
jgi:hypothetical protein